MACLLKGENPVKTPEDRMAIWKWAKDNTDMRLGLEHVANEVNKHFFNGQAHPNWITDIISGRKTPLKPLADAAWRALHDQRAVLSQARQVRELAGRSNFVKGASFVLNAPRSLSVFGHALGPVFHLTHGGDLILRPASWIDYGRGLLRSPLFLSKSFAEKALFRVRSDALYPLALKGQLDIGLRSHPAGFFSKISAFSQRSWDALTVTRFDLWKSAMKRWMEPGMSHDELTDLATHLAEWANHATGSGKGKIANLGPTLFGPKLTQSKWNRLTSDPAKTVATFADWKKASVGERAVARQRLEGALQYVTTGLGFLAANYGLIQAGLLGDKKQKINFTDPSKPDFLAFKSGGIEVSIPGLHSEIRFLGRLMALGISAYRGDQQKESNQDALHTILINYALGKANPGIQRASEVITKENFQQRPVPWSSQEFGVNKFGKESKYRPRLSWGEYLGGVGPIPTSGVTGYVYDHLRGAGASAGESLSVIKAAVIAGLSTIGFHAKESKDYEAPNLDQAMRQRRANRVRESLRQR